MQLLEMIAAAEWTGVPPEVVQPSLFLEFLHLRAWIVNQHHACQLAPRLLGGQTQHAGPIEE
jgi:hypothetical protein